MKKQSRRIVRKILLLNRFLLLSFVTMLLAGQGVPAQELSRPLQQFGIGKLRACVLSPDGTKILTGSGDGAARLWDAETGRLLQTWSGHRDFITSLAFAPDGRKFLTGCQDGTVRLWDLQSTQALLALPGHPWGSKAVFSPDGLKILTFKTHHAAQIWDARTGALLQTFPTHTDYVQDAVFSPDGSKILTGNSDTTAQIWDVASGDCLTTLTGHLYCADKVDFSPDGKTALTCDGEDSIRFWNAATGALIKKVSTPKGSITDLAFFPDGSNVIIAFGHEVDLMDVASGRLQQIISGYEDSISSLDFSRDGQKILTGCEDQKVRLHETQTGRLLQTIAAHIKSADRCRFFPDGKRVLTEFSNGITYDEIGWNIWDIPTGQLLRSVMPARNNFQMISFSPEGTKVATGLYLDSKGYGSYIYEVHIWDAETGELLQTPANDKELAGFSPDGTQLFLSGGTAAGISVWDIATSRTLKTYPDADGIVCTTEGRRLVKYEGDTLHRRVHLRDAETSQTIADFDLTGISISSGICFSPDGQWMLAGSYDCLTRIWDIKTGQLARTLAGQDEFISSAAWSPDGTKLLTCSFGGKIWVWDVQTGRHIKSFTSLFSNTMWEIKFSPDGKTFLTSGVEGFARLWAFDGPNNRARDWLGYE